MQMSDCHTLTFTVLGNRTALKVDDKTELYDITKKFMVDVSDGKLKIELLDKPFEKNLGEASSNPTVLCN